MRLLIIPQIILLFIISGCEPSTNNKEILIAIGSCSREYAENQLWTEINNESPELFIWTGDNIYGDSEDMMVLREKYDKQKSHHEYQALLNSIPIIGTWDDHDYGVNDGGNEFSMKSESKIEFMRFFDYGDSHPINTHEGVYHSYDMSTDGGLIKVLLLDTRYFRDPLVEDTITDARYSINNEGDILGEEQWEWLKAELESSEARLHIIASSIQLIAEEHGYEKWANFPTARNRMLDLLKNFPNKEVLIISGDRHISEFSKLEVDGLNYELYDFTSSGLTHSWGGDSSDEPNQYRIGPLIKFPNFGMINVNWKRKEVSLRVIGAINEELSSTIISYPNL